MPSEGVTLLSETKLQCRVNRRAVTAQRCAQKRCDAQRWCERLHQNGPPGVSLRRLFTLKSLKTCNFVCIGTVTASEQARMPRCHCRRAVAATATRGLLFIHSGLTHTRRNTEWGTSNHGAPGPLSLRCGRARPGHATRPPRPAVLPPQAHSGSSTQPTISRDKVERVVARSR